LQQDVSPEAISIDKRIADRKIQVAADIMATRNEASSTSEKKSDLYNELVKRYDDGRNPEAVLELYDAIESEDISESTSGENTFDFQDKEDIEVAYKKSVNPKEDTTKLSHGFVPLLPENKGDPYRRLDMVKAIKRRVKEIKNDRDFIGLNHKELNAEAAKSVLAEYLPRIDFKDKDISAQRQARTNVHPKMSESVKLQQINKIVSRITEAKSDIEILPGKDIKGNNIDINIVEELNKVRGDPSKVAKNILNKINLNTIFNNKKYRSLIGNTDAEVNRTLDNYKMENLLAEVGISAKFINSTFGTAYDVTPAAESFALTMEEKTKAKKERVNIQLAELDKQLNSKINKKMRKTKARDPAWFRDWEEKTNSKTLIRTRLIPDSAYKDPIELQKWKKDLKDNPKLKQELIDRKKWESKAGEREDNNRAIKRLQGQINKKAKEVLGDGAEFDAYVNNLYAKEEVIKQEFGEGQFDYREDLEQIVGSDGKEGTGKPVSIPENEGQYIEEDDLSLKEKKRIAKSFPFSTSQKVGTDTKQIKSKPAKQEKILTNEELKQLLLSVFSDKVFNTDNLSQNNRDKLREVNRADIVNTKKEIIAEKYIKFVVIKMQLNY